MSPLDPKPLLLQHIGLDEEGADALQLHARESVRSLILRVFKVGLHPILVSLRA